jgi:hypothetical protein
VLNFTIVLEFYDIVNIEYLSWSASKSVNQPVVSDAT